MALHDRTPVVFVAVQGRTAPVSLTRRVVSLEVDEDTKKATHFTLELEDADGAIRNGEIMREGIEIVFRWGWAGGAALGPPRAGIVHKIEPSYEQDTVRVEAFGRELSLSLGRVRHTFRSQTFRDAAERVVSAAGLKLDWRAPQGVRFDGQTIHNEHVWSWLLRRTAELGLEIVCEGDTLIVREPGFGDPPIRTLHYGWRNAELLEFTPETNTKKKSGESTGVVAVFFDPASGQVLSHAAGDPNTTRATLARRRIPPTQEGVARGRSVVRSLYALDRLTYRANQPEEIEPGEDLTAITVPDEGDTEHSESTQPPTSQEGARAHVRQIAQGKWKEAERQRAKAKCTADGDPWLRVARVVQVLGVAPRDAGLWYVRGCTHRIGDGYTVELELTRDGVNRGKGKRSKGHENDARVSAQTGEGQGQPREEAPEPVDLSDG